MDSALGFDGSLPYVDDHRLRHRAEDWLAGRVCDRAGEGLPGPAAGPPDVEALTLTFPASAEAPQLARRSLDRLEKSLDGDRLYELRLLVTELVTNSVRHAGLGPADSIGFEVAVTSDRTRIEVSDRGHGFDDASARTAGQGDDSADPVLATRGSGWGLHLVEQLCDRWGSPTRAGRGSGARSMLPGAATSPAPRRPRSLRPRRPRRSPSSGPTPLRRCPEPSAPLSAWSSNLRYTDGFHLAGQFTSRGDKSGLCADHDPAGQ